MMPSQLLEHTSGTAAERRIVAPGLLAEQVRNFDWASTSLGAIEQWSETMVSAVNQVLYTPGPATLSWGDELIFFYNDATIPTLGGKHPSALGSSYREVFAEAWPLVGSEIEACYRDGRPATRQDVSIPIIANGRIEDHYWTYSFIPMYEKGRIGGILNHYQNITEEKRLREESARNRRDAESAAEKLALAIEAGDLAMWYYDSERQILGGDGRMARLFELTELVGPAGVWIDKIHPEDRERVADEFAAALRGEPYDTEYRLCHGTSARWVRAKANQFGGKHTPYLFGICEDITARKTNEERLRSTAERLALAQTAARIVSWEWDIGSGSVSWTGSAEWILGRPSEQVNTAEKCLAAIHGEDLPSLEKALEPVLEGKSGLEIEYRVIWPDESVHWIYGAAETVFSTKSGEPLGIVGISIDVTERKASEAALLQNEKLAAVGRLSASIAHEINNPLESVTNLLYLVRGSTDLSNIYDYVDIAERELRRVALITNQTLRFHRQSTKANPAFCYDLIGDSLSIFQGRLVNNHIQVEKKKRAEHPVSCLGGEIRQVLSNLIGNAIDAMPSGGRLLLRSREETNGRTGRRGLVITVADTGQGMGRETQKRLFEAFYTTKDIGGTGLGLWISKEIVERHHGMLRVRSSQKKGHSGTVFTLFLPFETSDPEESPAG